MYSKEVDKIFQITNWERVHEYEIEWLWMILFFGVEVNLIE